MWQNAMLLKLGCSKKTTTLARYLNLNPQLLVTSNSSSTNHMAGTWLLQACSCTEGNLLKCKTNIGLGEKVWLKCLLSWRGCLCFTTCCCCYHRLGFFFFFFMISTISSNYREGSLKKNIQLSGSCWCQGWEGRGVLVDRLETIGIE